MFSPSLSPEEIYGNWSMPLNTSHIWHPRIREVGKEIGFEGRAGREGRPPLLRVQGGGGGAYILTMARSK